MRKRQLDHSVHIARAVAVFRPDDQRGAAACGESEKRLHQAALLEYVRSQIAEVSETVNEDPRRLDFLYRFRYLLAERFTLHFRGREHIVSLDFKKEFRRRGQIQNPHLIEVQMK